MHSEKTKAEKDDKAHNLKCEECYLSSHPYCKSLLVETLDIHHVRLVLNLLGDSTQSIQIPKQSTIEKCIF
jgi:hypothetical protein